MKSDLQNDEDAQPAVDPKLPGYSEFTAAAQELSAKFPEVAFVVIAAVGTEVMHTTNIVNNDQLRSLLRVVRRVVKDGDFVASGEALLH